MLPVLVDSEMYLKDMPLSFNLITFKVSKIILST